MYRGIVYQGAKAKKRAQNSPKEGPMGEALVLSGGFMLFETMFFFPFLLWTAIATEALPVPACIAERDHT